MPQLTYAGAALEAAPGETVLETLLRHGVGAANSCRTGACQSCLLRTACGPVPEVAQRGLKATLVEQGYFLACVCRPEGDLVLEPAGGLDVAGTIESLRRLTATVLLVRLRTERPLEFRAGQYITLRRGDGLARSYSVASLPEEPFLELHVRRAPMGRMSGWLFDQARAGESVQVRGPAGDCFYTAGAPEQPMLLAGTGTGLAPLAGISRDALRQGHTGPIQLYHGAVRPEGLYFQSEMRELERAHPNFRYTPVVMQEGEPAGILTGSLDRVISSAHPAMSGWRGYVCGDPAIVQMLKKKMFLAGMSSRHIFSDAFVEAPIG